MRERLRVFGLLILYWLGFMIVARALFLSYNADLAADLTKGDILKAMLYGLRMDGSMCGYYLAFAGLLLMFSSFLRGKWISYLLNTTTIFLVIFSSIIVTADLELYRHWGFRMNTTPIFYMGSGAAGSIEPGMIIKGIVILALLTGSFGWMYFRLIGPRVRAFKPAGLKSATILLIASASMFIPIRGSFTVAPMNTGFVYFHKTSAFANHAAINVVWNFLYSARKSTAIHYPENFYAKPEAEKLFTSLYPTSDSTFQILNTRQPNIIFIILESFTADIVGPLGGLKDITPNLNQLCHEGILFDNFYASGDRTDKGLISILSGYPAQPLTSIIKFPAKTQALPKLNHYLKNLGYKTSFLYGGDIDFANFRSYITTSGFDHITTIDDFPNEPKPSKWGIHDHLMFKQAMNELDTTNAPFSKVILTLSSHEPFDVPMEPHIKGSDAESMFLNSCYYADKSLGEFISYCKKQRWWNNTLVIMTADHGHRHPGNKELKNKRRFKTPLLMIGGAVKMDTVIHTVAGQTDIANTLLAQLDKSHPEFKFSKNILGNQVVPFAAYFFNDGYGFLLPDKHVVYDNAGKQFLEEVNATEQDLNLSKAYQQMLYSDYNKR